jgi:hypothetical protein
LQLECRPFIDSKKINQEYDQHSRLNAEFLYAVYAVLVDLSTDGDVVLAMEALGHFLSQENVFQALLLVRLVSLSQHQLEMRLVDLVVVDSPALIAPIAPAPLIQEH